MAGLRALRPASRFLLLAVTLAGLASWWALPSHASAGGGCRGEPVTTEETTTVTIGDMPCFSPTIIRVRPGDTVTWMNNGSLPHTVTGANASWGDYNELLDGQSLSHTFDAAGSYPYYCLLHPGMVGAVVVTDEAASSGAESASLTGSGVDGPPASSDATSGAGESDGNATTVIVLAAAAAVATATGLGGFALGRRRAGG